MSKVTRQTSRTDFERTAKRRQQDFKDASPTVSDKGRTPTDDKGIRHPHLLAKGCEVREPVPQYTR